MQGRLVRFLGGCRTAQLVRGGPSAASAIGLPQPRASSGKTPKRGIRSGFFRAAGRRAPFSPQTSAREKLWISEFVDWYRGFDPVCSRELWIEWYRYFGIDPKCTGLPDVQ